MASKSDSKRKSKDEAQSLKPYTIYFDGANDKTNPGPIGWGFVVYHPNGSKVSEGYGYDPETHTNNEAEYLGLISALEWVFRNIGRVRVHAFGDSNLVVQQVQGNWACNHYHLLDLKKKVTNLINGFRDFTITHIKRDKNTEADYLSKLGVKHKRHYVDTEEFIHPAEEEEEKPEAGTSPHPMYIKMMQEPGNRTLAVYQEELIPGVLILDRVEGTDEIYGIEILDYKCVTIDGGMVG